MAPAGQTNDRLRCETGGEWKTRDNYSKNQLDKYTRKARNGLATPGNSGISCREHSQRHTQEMKCNGPCGRWRDLRYFSKSTRRNGKNQCVDCTDWYLKSEVQDTLPAPNSQLSVEETMFMASQPVVFGDDMAFEHGVDASLDSELYFTVGNDTSDSSSTLPRSEQHNLAVDDLTDSLANCNVGEDGLDNLLPPHLRGPGPARPPKWFIPSMDERFSETSELSTASFEENSAQAPGSQRHPVTFNSPGPNGECARMVKTPTVVSSSTDSRISGRKTGDLRRNGWAKAPTRKLPPQLPDYLKYENLTVENGSNRHDDWEEDI